MRAKPEKSPKVIYLSILLFRGRKGAVCASCLLVRWKIRWVEDVDIFTGWRRISYVWMEWNGNVVFD